MAIDVTDSTFQTEVLERSLTTPVVVDLWAPWCGPCRTLGPILEKVVGETGGQVVLAKVNVDENPQISQAFRVQGIPAVYAVVGGQVVDGFIGAQPEHVVREFVGRLRPSEQEQELARLVEAGDEASLRRALEIKPDHEPAIVALAELLAGRRQDGDVDEALALLDRIPETPESRRVRAMLRTGETPQAAEDGDEITARLDELLERVKGDDEARQEFVDLLEVLGADDPRTAEYRRKLSRQLFCPARGRTAGAWRAAGAARRLLAADRRGRARGRGHDAGPARARASPGRRRRAAAAPRAGARAPVARAGRRRLPVALPRRLPAVAAAGLPALGGVPAHPPGDRGRVDRPAGGGRGRLRGRRGRPRAVGAAR